MHVIQKIGILYEYNGLLFIFRANAALLMNYGQFIDHDLAESLVNNTVMECCQDDTDFACFPIDIPPNDPQFENCLNFIRSLTSSKDISCQLGAREVGSSPFKKIF